MGNWTRIVTAKGSNKNQEERLTITRNGKDGVRISGENVTTAFVLKAILALVDTYHDLKEAEKDAGL